jgi:NADH-quinone oxidoreductase subunit M
VLKIPLLSGLIAISLIGSLLTLCVGREAPTRARWVALATVCMSLLFSGYLYHLFDPQAGLQFQENTIWIKAWNMHYALGVDGISFPLILLTILITLLVVLAAWSKAEKKLRSAASYLALVLLTQALVIGCFAATDSLFFYVCWELVLIPMLLLIGIWGSQNRAYAAIKFFMYTFLASAPLLLALLYLAYSDNIFNFSIQYFYTLKLSMTEQIWLFLAFLLAFAVKIPLWPVHTWLPDAHTEASAGGSMILAALMLKLGAYGLLRFSLPIVPDACRLFAMPLCGLALIAIILTGLIALAQQDMKRLVAYSSIAHMGLVVLGIFLIFPILQLSSQQFSGALMSLQGALFQMIAHAFSAAALFLAIGLLYQRFHTRLIQDYSGLAQTWPTLAAFFMLFALSNVGLPGTAGFIGEFLVIISAMQAHFWLSFAAATSLILSASYTFYLYKRVFWGRGATAVTASIASSQPISLTRLEKFNFSLLTVCILGLGLWPTPLFEMMHPALNTLLEYSLKTKL